MKTAASFLATVIAAFGGIGGATSTPAGVQPCVTIEHFLTLGSTGSDVIKLQQFLNVKSTGYFGPMTRSALAKWQIANHVVISAASAGAGQVGPKTRVALRCTVAINPPAAMPINIVTTSTVSTHPPVLATTTPQITPTPPVMGGGGGSGSSAGSNVSGCKPFTTPQPPASQCTIGAWILVEDEAGCPAEWDCQDPNASQ